MPRWKSLMAIIQKHKGKEAGFDTVSVPLLPLQLRNAATGVVLLDPSVQTDSKSENVENPQPVNASRTRTLILYMHMLLHIYEQAHASSSREQVMHATEQFVNGFQCMTSICWRYFKRKMHHAQLQKPHGEYLPYRTESYLYSTLFPFKSQCFS